MEIGNMIGVDAPIGNSENSPPPEGLDWSSVNPSVVVEPVGEFAHPTRYIVAVAS